MTPYTKSEEDRGFHDDRDEKPSSIFEARERDLPPLPDNEVFQAGASPLPKCAFKSSAPVSALFPSSLATPVSSLVRPKLHLDTKWDAPPRPAFLQEIHSAGDVTGWSASHTSLSTPSSSRQGSISTCTSSQEKLLPYSSSPYREPSSSASRNNDVKSCRFRSAVGLLPKLPASKLSTLVQTKRAVNASSSTIDSIRASPFIDSDPRNPLRGITVTVSRQRLVSEPMIMPLPELFWKKPTSSARTLLSVASASASTMSLVDLNLDKPLPTPAPPDAEDLHLPSGDKHTTIPAGSRVVQLDLEADLDPLVGTIADGDIPSTDPDSDLESDAELVQFKSKLSITVTPATATRMHFPPKRRKRYTTTGRPPTHTV
ncbi:hypothetical protein K438DRAFT_1835159 [Mycena galopus ATCC 62051]|nr:hypothetical protein K438DRAFT_1835159 [Mycena galopus ATCC 62051]